MGKIGKVKLDKVYTREQAIRAMKDGSQPPEKFLDMNNPYRMPDPKNPGAVANHPNYHTRVFSWKMQGRPMPFEGEERAKFFASLHMKDPDAVVEAQEPTQEETPVVSEPTTTE